jgi:plasmid maintenance system killer protein
MSPKEKNDVKWILLDQLDIIHECNHEELMKNPGWLKYYEELASNVEDFLFQDT